LKTIITDSNTINIEKHLRENLTFNRYRHSLSTAKTASELCSLFGYDQTKGFTAGLLHDIAREHKPEEIIALSLSQGENFSEYELQNPVILHGPAGAALIKKYFKISDPEILESVSLHTTGSPGMCKLSKIIFIADYIEPYRKHITREYLNWLKGKTLDEMLKTVLISTIDHLTKEAKIVSESTLKLLEELS